MNWLISGKGAMYNNTINNKNTAIPFPEFEKEKEPTKYYIPMTYPYYLPDRDMDKDEWGRMYYPQGRDS